LNDISRSDADEAADSTPATRAIDTLFSLLSQTDSAASRRDPQPIDVASETISEDLLELLADRDSDEL